MICQATEKTSFIYSAKKNQKNGNLHFPFSSCSGLAKGQVAPTLQILTWILI